jgi:KaiC/GvpD/RAD55 family RecA-like ATPase
MIPCIKSGIPGFDELTRSETGNVGIPENTSTLVYGPSKTGKSIFSNQFVYQGLLNEEPCLYITTDCGIKQLESNMNEFLWPINGFLEDKSLYVRDTRSDISEGRPSQSENIITSYINNPTDIMVKVGSGVHYIYKKNPRFRSLLDSATTLLAYNENMLIVRVLKAYLMRINEAGGTPIIVYTEDTADKIVETMLKSMVDNIIRLDGEELTVEAMKGIGKRSSPYKITEQGIVLL